MPGNRVAALMGEAVQEISQEEKPPARRRKGMKPTFKGIILWHLIALCLQLCQSLCTGEKHKIVDLSHEFNSDTIYWVTLKPLEMTVIHNGTAEGKNHWFQIEEISAGTHGGTHMDAPCHFVRGRWCVSDIPADRLVAPAVVVDISEHVKNDSNVHLTTEHLMSWEKQYGRIPDDSVLLIRTGWARHWPDRLAYLGTLEKDPNLLKFPSIKSEAGRWIAENRRIVGLGIDTVSLDIPGSPEPGTHLALEDRNIYGIENVNDGLQHLPPTGAMLYVMPMKLKGASGAPCRLVASIPAAESSAVRCTASACSMTVLLVAVVSLFLLCAES